jgi:hypothetical protein
MMKTYFRLKSEKLHFEILDEDEEKEKEKKDPYFHCHIKKVPLPLPSTRIL